MRQMLRKVMQDSVSIYDVAESYNAEGYVTKNRTLASGTIAQLRDSTGSERQLIQALVNAGNENIETITLVLPYGTNIVINQEVDTADNKTWNVIHTTSSQTYSAATIALLYRRVVNDTVVE